LEFIANGCKPIVDDDGSPLRFYINANAAIRYHREIERPRHILSVLRNLGTTELSRSYLRELGLQYDYPKPLPLIEYLLKIGCEDPDGLILDFFAGSGTTGQAALALNKQDGGNRKFILVQLPEPTEHQDQKTIADITKERMRRVVGKVDEETDGQLPLEGETPQDLGFRVFKLAESNFKTWEADVPKDVESLSRQLELHVDHVREGRTADDLLYEILLKSGFPLNTQVKELALAGKSVLSVADGALLICLEKEITPEVIDALADATPLQVICLDEAFRGNDQLKANAVQTFKARAQAEESEIVFRTV
jgi:adenine-specific DNA-methyltransferase